MTDQRNGHDLAPERPQPLPPLDLFAQSGAIMAAYAAVTGDPEMRVTARRLIGDDRAYAICCRAVSAMLKANVFNRSADTAERLKADLAELKRSHDYFHGGIE